MGSLFQARLTFHSICFLLLAGTHIRPQAAHCNPFSSRFFLADIASMCSQLQQKHSLHIAWTLKVPLAGFKVYQSTMHTEETKWDVSSCHNNSPMGVRTFLPSSASFNSFPRGHCELLVESVLLYLLNQPGNTAKVQYHPSSIPLSIQCNLELICSLSVPRSSGSDTTNQSLICS